MIIDPKNISQASTPVSPSLWLIQGIFFQNEDWLDLACGPDGNTVVIRSGLTKNLFSGVIYLTPESSLGMLTGSLNDRCGQSVLGDIYVDELKLQFTKKYLHREDLIEYSFTKKEGDVFVGEYDGRATGRGITRCVLTPIQSSFFDPLSAMKLLERSQAHYFHENN